MTVGLTSITPRRAIPMIADIIADGDAVMVWGPPGCAKSDVAREIAAAYFDGATIDNGRFKDIRLATTPPENFHLPVPNMTDKCIDWYPTRMIPDEVRDGPRGVACFDEITSAPPANAVLAYQAMLDRRIGDSPIPRGWGLIACGNRVNDRGVAYTMPSPLANRFVHFLFDPAEQSTRGEWLTDYCAYAAEKGEHPTISAFLQFCPTALYEAPKAGEVAFPTLRAWSKLSKAMMRADARGESIAEEIVTGTVGRKHGTAFLAFNAFRDDVPSFAEIVADPEGATCPTPQQLGPCFFVTGMVCHHASEKNFAQVARYLKRLPQEIDAAAVGMMAQAKRREILKTRAGQDWLVRVQHLIA